MAAKPPTPDEWSAATHELELRRLRAEIASVKVKYNSALTELETWEKRWDACSGLGQCTPRPIARPKLARSNATAAIFVLTDWHAEEDIDPATCGGLNKFNPSICEKRVQRATTKCLEVMEAWQRTWKIDELYVALLGDMIAGYIHEELQESNHMSPTEASLFAEQLIVDALGTMLKETKLPIVVPTSHGNHGRTTRKKRIKTSYLNSYEWLMYNHLIRDFRNEPRISFQIGTGYHNPLDIKGNRVRFHHGDSIKYQGGVGGISIPVNKAIGAWNKSKPADLDVFGHWHQYLEDWRWVSCGCLCGYSDFSVEIKADYQPPTQTLILLSKDHGKVATLPLFLE